MIPQNEQLAVCRTALTVNNNEDSAGAAQVVFNKEITLHRVDVTGQEDMNVVLIFSGTIISSISKGTGELLRKRFLNYVALPSRKQKTLKDLLTTNGLKIRYKKLHREIIIEYKIIRDQDISLGVNIKLPRGQNKAINCLKIIESRLQRNLYNYSHLKRFWLTKNLPLGRQAFLTKWI